MISIRKKLMTSILLVLIAVTFLLATITYFSVREEMDEFYDQNLKEVANTILATGPTSRTALADNIEIDKKLKGEEKYLTQVWKGNVLQYSSHPYVQFPLQPKNGKGHAQFQNGNWRFYSKTEGDITVQLAQDLKERHSIVVELYGLLLIPIVIHFFVLAGLIWFMIGYGLKPLQTISNLIKNRNSSFLEPLPQDDIPVEINILVHELNDLLLRLKQALELQREFVADAAHELRTPLTAVRLQLDVLKRADNEAESQDALQALEKGISRSTRLVQQLLELARHEPEKMEIEFSPVDLKQIIEDCIEHAKPIAKAKHISIHSNSLSSATIEGNSSKLCALVENLITNAILYTNEKGKVEVSLLVNDHKAILKVADNGRGIPLQDRERIFDRFYRIAGTGVTGSGLGLSIVKNVANLHHAVISIEDGIEGAGISFKVVFQAS